MSNPLDPPPDEDYDSRLTSVLPASRLDETRDRSMDRATDHEPTQSHGDDVPRTDSLQTGVLEISVHAFETGTDERTGEMQEQPPRLAAPRSALAGAAAAEGRFPLGSLLAGRYRIIRMLGRGGMGEVYCADDLELGQRVAIKLLPEAWEQDAARLERLRNEVRLARSVSHPNVCRVYDIGEIEGRRFLSMEYIGGEDLDSLLRRIGRLPADKAAELGLQICQGLTAIHDSGILHRDLKPANLMLDTRGRIRIADFGLASLVEDRPERGVVQGTPAYMAPEQLAAMEVSIQTDLYALGLILHKLLTGRPAFAARTVHELLRMRTESAPPPPSTLVSGIVPAVDAIIVRCLAPKPYDRPASAREVAVELAHGTAQGYAAALVVAVASSKLDSTALAGQAGNEVALRVTHAHDRMIDELCPYHAGTRASSSDDVELMLFEHPGRAVAHALAYQRALLALARREGVELPVRLGMHVGVRPRPDLGSTGDGARIEVDAATREVAKNLCKLAGPHQILLSRGAFDLARQESMSEPGKIQWLAHGSYEISGMAEPLEVCEVGVEGLAPLKAPRESALARRRLIQDVVVGWRPSPGMELPSRPHWIMERKLGEGGFGEVWLATHTKTRERRVFKFCYDPQRLRALQREITLFRLLKETLGDRDDIVRILDWSFEEAPYFIESAYTLGGNLIDWASAQGGLAAIALETRLAIVAQVATALAAAHSVGVLHKDVKPANVLMATSEDDRVQAQLGDFGIGALAQKDRLTEAGITALGLTVEATMFGAGAGAHGTRLYMAPEIIEGKPATMQADIYALGIMLYQVAVGDFTRSLAPGWERDIDDELLRADIAAAVDGNPQQRLGSAAQLAEKLRALPERRQELAARKQELAALEREREEAERTRVTLARVQRRRKIALVVVAVVVVFAGTATVQSLRVAREARAAAVAGQTAQQVSSFLVELFEEADPYATKGRDISAREILDRSKAKIDALSGQPEVQATLLHVMGVVYRNIGRYEESAALLRRAVDARRALHGPRHEDVAATLHALARTLEVNQSYMPAEQVAREALALRHELTGKDTLESAETAEVLANVLVGLDRLEEARPLYQQVLDVRRRLRAHEHADVAKVLAHLGMWHLEGRQYAEATQRYLEALDMYRRLPGDHTLEIAQTMESLGRAYWLQGDLAAAEPLLVEALAIDERMLGEGHPASASVMDQLARIYLRTGRLDQAEPLLQRLLALHGSSMGERSIPVATVLREQAYVRRARGDCSPALELARQVTAIYREQLGPDHKHIAASLYDQAYFHMGLGEHTKAEKLYVESLEMYRRLLGDRDELTTLAMMDLASFYVSSGQLAQAEPLIRQAAEQLGQSPSDGPWLRAHLDSVQGAYLSKAGNIEAGEELLLSAYESLRASRGAHRHDTKQALHRSIAFYDSQGRSDQASKYRALPHDPPCMSMTQGHERP